MKILLTNAGKRYNREWIFRNFSHSFETSNTYAITGPNGSGKSTLLQVISGSVLLNEGQLTISAEDEIQNPDKHYQLIAISAPYLDLIEEMTAVEFLEFHQHFKPFQEGLDPEKIIGLLGLNAAAHKQIRYYSSGMKQRIKLAQSILTDTPFTLLDEPCTNLDKEGIELYHSLIHIYGKNKCIVVSSNDENEYGFCKEMIDITQYK
ncbi:MAG: ABC transporter ATP-binding protein [Chitinophagaceae bacterium]